MDIFNVIDAHLENPTDERLAGEVVEQLQTLFRAASTGQRLKAEQEWYLNERYREGDHWLRFDRTTGKIHRPKPDKRVRRPINLVRKQIRGIKNFVTSQRVTWMVSPSDESPAGVEEARINGQLLQGYLYDKLDVPQLLYDVFDNAIMKYYGSWEVYWDDETDDLAIEPLDSFDVYPDPAFRNPRDGSYLFKTAKATLSRIKGNERYYPWRANVQPDNKASASEFKDSLEKSRGDKEETSHNDHVSTAIVYNCFLKRPVPDQTKPQIWIAAYAGDKLLRCEPLKVSRFPIPLMFPERTNHRLYGATWAKDLYPINRTFENAFSAIEDYILKIKPKLMRPKGSAMNAITDELGEFLEYSNAIPDQLKEFMPQGLPATHFKILDVCRELIEDIGGVHEASLGKAPAGIKAGIAIEALQAGDDMNVDQPKSMLERFLEETGELLLELIATHQVTQTKKSFNTGDDVFSVQMMGQEGLMDEGAAPEGLHVVKPSRVRVKIPRMHYQFYLSTLRKIREGHLPSRPAAPTQPAAPAAPTSDPSAVPAAAPVEGQPTG